jgi:outer membrane protein assembly factor BamA
VDQAIAEANDVGMDATNEAWLKAFVEAGIRDAWQDRGYFQVTVGRAEAEPLGGDSHEEHFRVLAPINEGLQYHLGDLTFVNANAFSSGELRNLIPLKEGEIFDVSKIRSGIAALWKQYAAIGYIDFTAVPKTEIDDKLQRISVALELDEQRQYRIGEVKAIGLDPTLMAVLGCKICSGEIFNEPAIDDFVEQNRSSLPANLSRQDYLQEKRDTRRGIVDLTLDFRALDARGCREAIP